ncbi:hypothetical protein OF117_11395 [Geodermatophilus sp. YIM 151500]|uniref:hypothetical protein n=1 Tax=Geodermatophilus sp. YIM 151500 TaxID=2984531 RepID=UPI0021E3BBDA|nr:hypothetical protein [Geodermatophilus sp. YIM 151500]MCV2489967.1 hypothetical protein [Geodermatophilus sp. YIM 151500]
MTPRPASVVALAATLAVLAFVTASGVGLLELGLVLLSLFLLALPVLVGVLAFYLWARRRGDVR